MTKIGLKILLIALISSFIFFFNSDNTKSCWYEYIEPINGLFNGDVIVEPTLSPFFYVPNPDYYGTPTPDASLNPVTDNLKEWFDYFEQTGSNEELNYLIYKATVSEVESVIYSIENHKNSIEQKLMSNSIIKYLIKKNSTHALNYLKYAKQCEPNAIGFRKSEWDELVRDSLEMRQLVNIGLEHYSNCNDNFIKLRYAYQIIRLTHYLNDYKETISFFDSLITPLNSHSIIKYWSMSHKAGALLRIGEYAKSMYLFSKIFDECLSKRLLAEQNFKINEASLLNETLDLCQNNHEKAVIWFLHSLKNNDMRGLKRIYELDPGSPYLEVLLARAIERLEEDIFIDVKDYKPNWSNNFTRIDHKQFIEFVEKVAANRNTKRPYFWEYCAGYLSVLKKDYKSMALHFANSSALLAKDSDDLLERMKIIQIYAKADSVKDVNLIFESKITDDFKWLLSLNKRHANEAFKWSMLKLADKYLEQKDTAKYLLCLGQKLTAASDNNTVNYLDYKSNPRTISLEKLIGFLQNTRFFKGYPEHYKISKLDEFLIDNFYYTYNDLLEIEGTMYLSMFDFNSALNSLYLIKDELELLPVDPFKMNIRDCINCNTSTPTAQLYNKYTFAKKMLDLEKEIKFSNKNKAENYFLLANAYYNITYFGNCWMMADFYRSYSYYSESPNVMDCSKAEEYYLKALALSNSKEFQAQCLFMAAKCEQNRFYIDKGVFLERDYSYPYDYDQSPQIKKENYREYFKKLKRDYSKTEFYKQALKECKYFNYFVTNK